MTVVWKILGDEQLDQHVLEQATAIIKNGGLVAFPTETVYGLGANALSDEAVQKIFTAKQRPQWDPVIAHVGSLEMLKELIINMPPHLEKIMNAFMPGPLTVLLDKKDVTSKLVTSSNGKISLRFPSHPIAQKLITLAGVPIAAPSANLFGHTSPTTAAHVLKDLDGSIDGILDAGQTFIGVESTVIDLTQDPPMIMRPGGVTKEDLEKVIGPVSLFNRHVKNPQAELSSPGTMLKHYAPKARVMLFEPTEENLKNLVALQQEKKIGVMLPNSWQEPANSSIFRWGTWGNWEQLAHNLFQGLRELDELTVEIILCPLPNTEGLGLALRDRLLRAAA